MMAGEAFLASKEESALEQLKEAADKAEMVAAGLATGWSDEELQAGGWQGTSSEEFAMRANPDSYAGKAKQGVSRPGQLFSPTKKSNPYETMTDSQFRMRHDKWSGGEKVERGRMGWAVYPRGLVEGGAHWRPYSGRSASCTSEGCGMAEFIGELRT